MVGGLEPGEGSLSGLVGFVLVCSLCESLILDGLSHLPPPPVQDISKDTRDFFQVSNHKESPSTVEKGTPSQC